MIVNSKARKKARLNIRIGFCRVYSIVTCTCMNIFVKDKTILESNTIKSVDKRSLNLQYLPIPSMQQHQNGLLYTISLSWFVVVHESFCPSVRPLEALFRNFLKKYNSTDVNRTA